MGNYRLRQLTKTNIPYTQTILPAFIQPYARKATQTIIHSITEYIHHNIESHLEAAFLMGAETPKSFGRYFTRVKDRIDQWLVCLFGKISEITSINAVERKPDQIKTITQKWADFIFIIKDYIKITEQLDTGFLIQNENRICFVLAILTINNKGLGP